MVTVYVLQGRNKRYVGITNHLSRRLAEHRSGHTQSARVIGEFKLLHTEKFSDYNSARKREKCLKSGQGREFLDRLYLATGSAPPEAGKLRRIKQARGLFARSEFKLVSLRLTPEL